MITVHGLLGRPSTELRSAASSADLVVGGLRPLDALGVEAERRVVLGALSAALDRLADLPPAARAVVVASGDPLYFGIVRALRARGLRPAVVPAVSSVAAAFASVGLPWDDAAVVSVHGRPLATALQLARTTGKVAVLTSAEHGLRQLAEALPDGDRWFVLAERLGEEDQRVLVLQGRDAAHVEPREPNVVLILDRHPDAADEPWAGTIAGPSLHSPTSTGAAR